MKKLFALRGAVQTLNNAADIRVQVAALYRELLHANNLAESDIVSLVFSVTPDLTAQNPCAALRQEGYAENLALFAVQEAATDGMMNHVIRILIHCYMEENASPAHAYMNGAEKLRPDRKLPKGSAD
ncbi:MAG: chorismate mutase [Spirochaetaceae bacterium]|jgi:chorismate mutase|nr:chorismate mutase [Spirochaetaceae bacterium]